MTKMKISICPFQHGAFDVIIKDGDGNEVTLTGHKKLSEEEFDIVNRLAPACVFTTYTMDEGQ